MRKVNSLSIWIVDEAFCSLTQKMTMGCRDFKVFIASIDVQAITAVIATIAKASEASEVSPTRLRRTRAETKVVAIEVVAANYIYLRNDCSPPLPAIFDFFLKHCVVIFLHCLPLAVAHDLPHMVCCRRCLLVQAPLHQILIVMKTGQ